MVKTVRLSTNAIEFIYLLLSRELQAEYIQDNENPEEVEYLQDLIKVSKEFGKAIGFPYSIVLEEDIERLEKGE